MCFKALFQNTTFQGIAIQKLIILLLKLLYI
jgi:hypothetical protein